MIKYNFLEIIQQLELTLSWLDWLCGRSCRYLGPCAIPGSAQLQLSSTLALRWLQARASATLHGIQFYLFIYFVYSIDYEPR